MYLIIPDERGPCVHACSGVPGSCNPGVPQHRRMARMYEIGRGDPQPRPSISPVTAQSSPRGERGTPCLSTPCPCPGPIRSMLMTKPANDICPSLPSSSVRHHTYTRPVYSIRTAGQRCTCTTPVDCHPHLYVYCIYVHTYTPLCCP